MIETIRERLGDLVETWDAEAGMHTVAWLPPGMSDLLISAAAARGGLFVLPASEFALRPMARGGLLLGYAAFARAVIRKGIRDLELLVRKYARRPQPVRLGREGRLGRCG
jgi:GntR family transcriptional regulator/MocR family aminotransferase